LRENDEGEKVSGGIVLPKYIIVGERSEWWNSFA